VSRRRRAAHAAAALGAALALGLLAGCAPRPSAPADVTRDQVRERFARGLAERGRRAGGIEANLLVWPRVEGERAPGFDARLLLSSPGRARVRVAAPFGTAVDLALRGDSAIAWIPSRRAALAESAEALGLPDPARWLVTALTATWQPPADAWARADRRDSTVRLVWREDGRRRELDVGASGLPRAAREWAGEGPGLEIAYHGWIRQAGAQWPARGSVASEDRRWSADWRLERYRFVTAPDASRFRVAPPGGATRITWAELREALGDSVGDSDGRDR
jgi:hypothetical protein